jgi:hypothetical protein
MLKKLGASGRWEVRVELEHGDPRYGRRDDSEDQAGLVDSILTPPCPESEGVEVHPGALPFGLEIWK